MKKSVLGTAAKYLLGAALLAFVIWQNRVGLADAIQKPLQPTPLALATAIMVAGILLTFVRWYVLVRVQHLPFTLGNALRLGLIGFALSAFLPGSVGGDIIKAYCIAREQSRRTVAVATVLIDRAVGLWGLFWLVALVGSTFWALGDNAIREYRSLQVIIAFSVALVVGTTAVWFLLGILPQWRAERFAGRLTRLAKVGHMAAEFWRAIWMYRCQGQGIFLALGLALVGHVCFVLTYYFAAQAFLEASQLGKVPSLVENYVIIPIGMTVQALVPSPGGMGFGEYSFGKLYSLIGKPEANGVLASLVYRVISWGLGFIGYLVYLRMRPALPVIADEPGTNGRHDSWRNGQAKAAAGATPLSAS